MFTLGKIFSFLCMTVFIDAYRKVRTQLQLSQGRILGGKDARIVQYPFMVKLYIEAEYNSILCGGTYVKTNWVLTAAHCLDMNDVDAPPSVGRGNRVDCVMGISIHRKQTGYQSIRSSRLFCHPKYFRNYTHIQHDLGLILLQRPFNLTKVVQLAVLPKRARNYDGEVVTILGYGLSQMNAATGESSLPKQLQMLRTKVRSTKFCKNLTGSEDVICIGKKGKISCTGDSGGPMVYNEKVIGVCSHGFGCSSEFGIYEKVYRNMKWLMRITPIRTRMQSGSVHSGIVRGAIVYTILIIACFLNL